MGDMQAVVSTTVSPYRAVIAPFACLAIFPVSRMRARPPTSTETWCGAGIWVFSDITVHFLWTRLNRGIFSASAGGPTVHGAQVCCAPETNSPLRVGRHWPGLDNPREEKRGVRR